MNDEGDKGSANKVSPHWRYYVEPIDRSQDHVDREYQKVRCPVCNLLFMNENRLTEHKPICNPKILRYEDSENQKGLLVKGSPYKEVTMTTRT